MTHFRFRLSVFARRGTVQSVFDCHGAVLPHEYWLNGLCLYGFVRDGFLVADLLALGAVGGGSGAAADPAVSASSAAAAAESSGSPAGTAPSARALRRAPGAPPVPVSTPATAVHQLALLAVLRHEILVAPETHNTRELPPEVDIEPTVHHRVQASRDHRD